MTACVFVDYSIFNQANHVSNLIFLRQFNAIEVKLTHKVDLIQLKIVRKHFSVSFAGLDTLFARSRVFDYVSDLLSTY